MLSNNQDHLGLVDTLPDMKILLRLVLIPTCVSSSRYQFYGRYASFRELLLFVVQCARRVPVLGKLLVIRARAKNIRDCTYRFSSLVDESWAEASPIAE
jgi:hypothetical protein